MADIFLSYKREEKSIAQIFAGLLELKGFSVWWDPDIYPGERFHDIIQAELDLAKCVVVLWSKRSVASKWVKAEATNGDDKNILVPVLIENVRIPVPFNVIQAVDLIDWRGDPSNPEFLRLVGSVSKKVGSPIKNKKQEKEVFKEEKIPAIYTNSIGMKFALILKGDFMMGSEENDTEKPIHKVTIESPFYLGMYQVTQKEWETVMGNNPSTFKGDNLPVETISWNDVQDFVKKLNEKESANKYRLPSEAEWEYAARAGTTMRYSFGDDESKLGDYAWFWVNSDSKTHDVGQKKPNPWGLYDIHGNVWEWVQGKWHGSYEGAPTEGSSRGDEDNSVRVFRGGGWADVAGNCRSAFRLSFASGFRDRGLGFRLLRDL